MAWTPLLAWGPPYRPHILSLLPCPPTPASWSRFDAGSGMATIRHPTPLALGQFHTVTLLRSLTQGSLIVGSLAPVNGTSQVRPSPVPLGPAPPPPPPSLAATHDVPSAQGKFQGLDLNEELYLGGYPDYGAIPKAGLSSGFVGEPPHSRLQPWPDLPLGWPSPWSPGRTGLQALPPRLILPTHPRPQAVSESCASKARRSSSTTSTSRPTASPTAPPVGTGPAR